MGQTQAPKWKQERQRSTESSWLQDATYKKHKAHLESVLQKYARSKGEKQPGDYNAFISKAQEENDLLREAYSNCIPGGLPTDLMEFEVGSRYLREVHANESMLNEIAMLKLNLKALHALRTAIGEGSAVSIRLNEDTKVYCWKQLDGTHIEWATTRQGRKWNQQADCQARYITPAAAHKLAGKALQCASSEQWHMCISQDTWQTAFRPVTKLALPCKDVRVIIGRYLIQLMLASVKMCLYKD